MNGGYRREDEPEASAQRNDWRRIHHSPLFWVGFSYVWQRLRSTSFLTIYRGGLPRECPLTPHHFV
jgi:hypothetical protein